MKEFLKRIGGTFWATVGALSIVVTVVGGFGLPFVVDTSNPWIVFILCATAFVIGAFNGWKQRGFSNEHDVEYADALERERMEIAKENEAEIARIVAEKDLEIDKRNRSDRAEAERRDEKRKRKAAHDRLNRMKESIERLTPPQMELIACAMLNGGACTAPKKSTDAALLGSLGVFEDLRITDAVKSHWKLSDSAMEVISEHPNLEDAIKSASIKMKDAKARESFEHADYLEKLIMMFCYRNEVAEVTSSLFNRVRNVFFRYIYVGDDSVQLYLADDMREMIDRNRDVLKFCEPEGDVDQWIKDEIGKESPWRW